MEVIYDWIAFSNNGLNTTKIQKITKYNQLKQNTVKLDLSLFTEVRPRYQKTWMFSEGDYMLVVMKGNKRNITVLAVCFMSLGKFKACILYLTMPNFLTSIYGFFYYYFQGYQCENLQLVNQQYRAWSDCTNLQAGLALYC